MTIHTSTCMKLLLLTACFSFYAASSQIRIGNQEWMDRNLNVDRFQNGDLIPEAKTKAAWYAACDNNQPAWCYYAHDPANGELYGRIYNLAAVRSEKGLCPTGWRIPRDSDWDYVKKYCYENNITLSDEAGWTEVYVPDSARGIKVFPKRIGFKAPPGGRLMGEFYFFDLKGELINYWSLGSSNPLAADWRIRGVDQSKFIGQVSLNIDEVWGQYVRCIKK